MFIKFSSPLYWSFYFWSKSSMCWHASLLTEFHTKSPLKGHMVTGYRNLSQKIYVLGNSKFILAGNVWNVCWNIGWDNVNHFYQNSFITVKVDWKNSTRSRGVLGLTSWFCLKASIVYPAIHNRIPAGAPAGARSYWKHFGGETKITFCTPFSSRLILQKQKRCP